MPCRNRLTYSSSSSRPSSNSGKLRHSCLNKREETPAPLLALSKHAHHSTWDTMSRNLCRSRHLSPQLMRGRDMKLTNNINCQWMKFKMFILLHKITAAAVNPTILKKKKLCIIHTISQRANNNWNLLPILTSRESKWQGMSCLRDLTQAPLKASTIISIHQRTLKKKESRSRDPHRRAITRGSTTSQLRKWTNSSSNNRMRITTCKSLPEALIISLSSQRSHTKETPSNITRVIKLRAPCLKPLLTTRTR